MRNVIILLKIFNLVKFYTVDKTEIGSIINRSDINRRMNIHKYPRAGRRNKFLIFVLNNALV